jgi:type II secretory pathway component PulK
MRLTRSGFALLTVLWAIVALGTVAGISATLARRGFHLTRNRIALAQAGWAREACVSILHARFGADQQTRRVDSVDLGRGAWCSATLLDPSAQLNVNLSSPVTLHAALGDSLAGALLDWRDADDDARPNGAEADWYREHRRPLPRNAPLASAGELRLVRGFEGIALDHFTTRGDGRINPAIAPHFLVRALPGVDEAVVAAIESRGRMIASLDALLSIVPPSARSGLLAHYSELQSLTTFAPTVLIAHVQGAVGSSTPRSSAWLTLMPVGDRLAVISREAE